MVADDDSDYEVDDIPDTTDNSVRGRLAAIVKTSRSALDIRGASLRLHQRWIIRPHNR